MNDDACDRYLEDPEANAAHLVECRECAALFASLDEQGARGSSVAVESLPLAPWEGAKSSGTWRLVTAVLIVFASAAALAMWITGISMGDLAAAGVADVAMLPALAELAGDGLRQAPGRWQIGLVVAFVVVNIVFVALLRRPTRGLDA